MNLLRRSCSFLIVLSCMTVPCYGAKSLRVAAGNTVVHQLVDGTFFHADPKGWTVAVDLSGHRLEAEDGLFRLTNGDGMTWLSASISQERTLAVFSLKTDYKNDPLTVAVPLGMLEKGRQRRLLLRYQRNSLDLYIEGVLVDQEWPLGEIVTGDHPLLELPPRHPSITIWAEPISNAQIERNNGGAKVIAARTDLLLGPEPKFLQYSRPRGWNTNAGDAMPYFHDGEFHLYYLLDRRQHHSKWGLGAHQWTHISSRDLVHWTHYPVALGIDSDWEGSICTGSVFFNGGKYYAFYATRLRDRSERLAVAVGSDSIHFKKLVSSFFAEPAPPYVHGPNRDPFVFEVDGRFHMLVTAALRASDGKTEGALEHLTSNDLAHWTVEAEPFLRSSTEEQPECSDLFQWRSWYYLLYSLSGVTHYKIAKSPLGPWTKPENEIIDGPEAIVMKAAAFRDDRFIATGFLQHDNHYGGDLVFRELVQEQDGSLGSKFPEEMMRPRASSPISIKDLHASTAGASAEISVSGNDQLNGTILAGTTGRFSLAVDCGNGKTERLSFDRAGRTVEWIDSDGKPEHAVLKNVQVADAPLKVTLVLHGTIADVQLNENRTLLHRLAATPHKLCLEAQEGEVSMTQATLTAIQ